MRTATLLFLLILAAGTARADDNRFYLGAGASRDQVNNFLLAANPQNTRGFPDIGSTSWKMFLAVRPISFFAVEADYVDFGSATRNFSGGPNGGFSDRSEGDARAVYAVGLLPFGGLKSLDFFAKVGVSNWNLTATFTPSSTSSESDSGSSFAWALGLQTHVGHFGARIEYEDWKMGLTNGAQVFSLSAVVML